MHKYPKIDNLFRRNDTTHKMTDQLKNPYWADVSRWYAEEKIDGQNLRIIYTVGPRETTMFRLAGRTDEAQLNQSVYRDLIGGFCLPFTSSVEAAFPDYEGIITLYGEGVGPKIQGNPYKLGRHQFWLFDVKLGDGPFGWLPPPAVTEVAEKLGLSRAPCTPNVGSIDNILLAAAEGGKSMVNRDVEAEGIVCKPRSVLYDNRGRRLIFKLKPAELDREAAARFLMGESQQPATQ